MIDPKKYVLRPANTNDIEFIADVIIAAEKSGTNHCGLANFYDITVAELKDYLIQILEEEVDGCELSLSSFLIIEYEGETVAALGGWLEGENEDEMPSALLKSNLLGYVLPTEKLLASREKFDIVKPLQIEREQGTYQLEYSFVKPEHTGQFLVQWLMEEHEALAKKNHPDVKHMQAHVFANNKTIVLLHEMMGFYQARVFKSDNIETLKYFPYNEEILMQKDI